MTLSLPLQTFPLVSGQSVLAVLTYLQLNLRSHITNVKDSLVGVAEESGALRFFSTLKSDKWRRAGQPRHLRLAGWVFVVGPVCSPPLGVIVLSC